MHTLFKNNRICEHVILLTSSVCTVELPHFVKLASYMEVQEDKKCHKTCLLAFSVSRRSE